MERFDNVTGVVLAGGLSTRIGRDKGRLDIGGVPQWSRPVERLRLLFSEVIYATNDPDFKTPSDLKVTLDEVPHLGPLGGILAALKAAATERVFVVAYDMPFVQEDLVRYLVRLAPKADVTVPVIGGKLEPLHAVYNRSCADVIEEQLKAGRRKIIDFYQTVIVHEVPETDLRRLDPELLSFFNINTWEDVERAEGLIAKEQP